MPSLSADIEEWLAPLRAKYPARSPLDEDEEDGAAKPPV
jgi:hypothetical protein